MPDMLALARTRYTTKHYDPARKLEPKLVESLAEILRLSASSVNIQPWHFVFIESPEAKAKLMPCVKDFNIERVQNAPLVVLFCAQDVLDDAYLDRLRDKETADGRYREAADPEGLDAMRRAAVAAYCKTPELQKLWTHEQVMLAMGSFLTSCAGMGLDSTCLGGLFWDKTDETFGLKEKGLHAVCACAVGFRLPTDANAQRPKSRFALDDVVTRL